MYLRCTKFTAYSVYKISYSLILNKITKSTDLTKITEYSLGKLLILIVNVRKGYINKQVLVRYDKVGLN